MTSGRSSLSRQIDTRYNLTMSRIGNFEDDDETGIAVRSPDLGTAMAQFTNAV